MKNKGYRGAIGWAVLLLSFFTQVAYGQDTGDFTVYGDKNNYSFANNVLTVSGGEVTVSTTGQITSQTIKLTGGKLILEGVEITVSSGTVSPIEVEGTAEIHLADGSPINQLISTTVGAAGIHVPPGSQVTFTGEGNLSVNNTVKDEASSSSCGIGGKQGTYSCGTIIFNHSCSIIAYGGSRAAGIGTCMSDGGTDNVSGSILIKQGNITAHGGAFAAAVGTGPDGSKGGGVSVTMVGGDVTCSNGGGNIGSGFACQTPVDIFLLGGTYSASVSPGKGSSPFNTLIIGPDLMSGTVPENYYTNGFVFSGPPTTATVKGNPVFPKGKEITIDAGETLNVPPGTTLFNEGTIINNGTITGPGTIAGNIPAGWTGNIKYKVSYNANGGTGTVENTYHAAGTEITLPSPTNLSKKGYTFLGWNTTNNATTALTEYTVQEGTNTLYAVWELTELKFNKAYTRISITVGETFGKDDLLSNVSNAQEVLGVTFAVKTGFTLPDGFSLAENGELTGTGILTTAMEDETVVTVTPGNGAPAEDWILEFTINKGTLLITPAANQTIYADEYPAYTLPGYITDKEALVTGNLAIEKGKITMGTLALTEKGQKNYDAISLSAKDIAITQTVEKAADQTAQITPASPINAAGWYTDKVTLTAPAGFQIWVESILKSTTPTLKDSHDLTEDGNYTEYKLVRITTNKAYPHPCNIKLDRTAPVLKAAPTVSNLQATFTLADALSGIASYSYALDGGSSSGETQVSGSPKEHPVSLTSTAGAHRIVFTVKDVAGNEASLTSDFTLANPAPPVDPPTPPTTYYTVTLPAIEGATTDPLPGDYEIESWDTFRFYLTLDEGYRENSKPVVTTDRYETIEPRRSDGAYLVKYIRRDVVISISGIVPDIPTANAEINDATLIRVVDGTLHITVPRPTDLCITDLAGRLQRTRRLSPGETRIEGLSRGIYILQLEGQEARKVLIR